MQSTGYVFQTDLVTRCLRAGLTVREVPIEFVERVRGDSKMSGAVATESLRRITSWGLRERRDQVRRALSRKAQLMAGRRRTWVGWAAARRVHRRARWSRSTS